MLQCKNKQTKKRCHNKVPQNGWFQNNRKQSLSILEAAVLLKSERKNVLSASLLAFRNLTANFGAPWLLLLHFDLCLHLQLEFSLVPACI